MPCWPCDAVLVLCFLECCLEEEWLADAVLDLDFVFADEEWLADVVLDLGLVLVVVVLADAAPGKSSKTANILTNWNKRFPIDNDHLNHKSMNFRITAYCNEALTKRETRKRRQV